MTRKPFLTLLMLGALLLGWATAQPTPSVGVSDGAELLGGTVTLTASFENSGSDVGYGPYLDVVLPDTADPLSFVGATYLGRAVDVVNIEFGPDGWADHPFAVDGDGDPIRVNGPANGVGYALVLPFGSVTSGQPAIDVQIELAISEEATVGAAAQVEVTPGFRYGANPLDDPLNDAPLRGAVSNGGVTPRVANFSKSLVAPEDDTPVGDSFTFSYVMELELAPGQEFTQLSITDTLPTALVMRGGTLRVQRNGAALTQGADYTATLDVTNVGSHGGDYPTSFPGAVGDRVGPFATSHFDIELPGIVDTGEDPGPTTITVAFDFYVPSVDANGLQAGDPSADDQEENRASYAAVWAGNSGNPGATIGDGPSDGASASTRLHNESNDHQEYSNGTIRLQKWVEAEGEKNHAVVPGDTVTYILDFQVSDVSAFRDVVISDVLGDGLSYVDGSARLVEYYQHGVPSFTPLQISTLSSLPIAATKLGLRKRLSPLTSAISWPRSPAPSPSP